MKRFTKIRTLLPVLFLLLGTIPVSAAERPFALSGTGVATLIVNEQGMPIGAIFLTRNTVEPFTEQQIALLRFVSVNADFSSKPLFARSVVTVCPTDPPFTCTPASHTTKRRGAAVAATNNCIGRSELQLP